MCGLCEVEWGRGGYVYKVKYAYVNLLVDFMFVYLWIEGFPETMLVYLI